MIDTLDKYIGAAKQRITWMKTGTRTVVASLPYSTFDLAGNPGAGALAIGNTANGLVPVATTAGYPVMTSFSSQLGYLSKVEFGSSVPCCLDLYDRVFAAGAYVFNANVTLATQPSYAGRIVGSNYNGLQLWIEAVTGFTGALGVRVTYLDQDGNAGDTGVVAVGALPIGRCFQMPLAAGDSGIQKIVSVVGSTATVGTFNVMVLRPLWFGRVKTANDGDVHDLLKTGFPQIFETSALYMLLYADAIAVGLPDCSIQIAMG